MSASTIPAITIPGIPISCAVQLPAISPSFPGLIALGPTRSERDILYQCCRTVETQLFSVNDTSCLQTTECRVEECTLNDPSYACVVLQRESWKVSGTFACLEASKESKGGKVKRHEAMCVAVGIVVGVASFSAI